MGIFCSFEGVFHDKYWISSGKHDRTYILFCMRLWFCIKCTKHKVKSKYKKVDFCKSLICSMNLQEFSSTLAFLLTISNFGISVIQTFLLRRRGRYMLFLTHMIKKLHRWFDLAQYAFFWNRLGQEFFFNLLKGLNRQKI